MGKAYSSEDLARRTFIISMVGVLAILVFFIVKFIQVIGKKNGSHEE